MNTASTSGGRTGGRVRLVWVEVVKEVEVVNEASGESVMRGPVGGRSGGEVMS